MRKFWKNLLIGFPLFMWLAPAASLLAWIVCWLITGQQMWEISPGRVGGIVIYTMIAWVVWMPVLEAIDMGLRDDS